MKHEDARERRLIQLLCGTAAGRQERRDEIASLADEVEMARLVPLLRRTRLLVLAGGRLCALGVREAPELERELAVVSAFTRKWGAATELASLEILDRLTAAGIRALPLKGSLLARELYGDVGARSSSDVDVLIAAEDLHDAVGVLSGAGWRWDAGARRVDGLPALHETLVHPRLPPVELHWRVHWYERQFAADALGRARSRTSGAPLEMEPLDGLIALMLFYARDGFVGLRLPADVAAWWDLRCANTAGPSPAEFVAQHYPALTAPVSVAATLLRRLVGVPADDARELPFRWRVAEGLASPFLAEGGQQAEANAGLADVLLAPPNAAADAIVRVARNGPLGPRDASSTRGKVTAGHLLRVARRWVAAFVPAVLRIYAPSRRPE